MGGLIWSLRGKFFVFLNIEFYKMKNSPNVCTMFHRVLVSKHWVCNFTNKTKYFFYHFLLILNKQIKSYLSFLSYHTTLTKLSTFSSFTSLQLKRDRNKVSFEMRKGYKTLVNSISDLARWFIFLTQPNKFELLKWR